MGGAAILGVYGVTYFATTHLMRVEECAGALRRLRAVARRVWEKGAGGAA
jgi:hypothetical protein